MGKIVKKYIFWLIFLLPSSTMAERDVEIGEEYIVPLRFPKFSLSGEYVYGRKFHGFADDSLRTDLRSRYETALSFEAGLVKFFNAGALFSISMSEISKSEPMALRMGLFGKPLIPLGNRVAIFGRLSVGVAVDIAFNPAIFYYATANRAAFDNVYHSQRYDGWPFGGFGSATIGLEAFPFSRFGLSVEWGIRASLFHSLKNALLFNPPPNIPGAPDSFNFMYYEMPIMATLHIIL